MKQFCDKIFPRLQQNISDTKWLEGRAILAPTNRQVDSINDLLVEQMTGEKVILHSSDALDNQKDIFRYNTEYLNSLNPTGLPQSKLCLKPGMPVMLLRNLNPTGGLCNGTKLVFKEFRSNRLLVCKTVGEETEREVYIPRISLRPKEKQYPFEWSRRQFPIRVAFSTTINKAQGQTLKAVGVWLPEPVFSHGQFYVAGSRVGAPRKINYALKQSDPQRPYCTKNIVYKEVFSGQGQAAMETQEEEEEEEEEELDMDELDIEGWLPTDDYEGPHDDEDADDGVTEEDTSTGQRHHYNLRPTLCKRSCSPARRADKAPKTVPRPLTPLPPLQLEPKSAYEKIRDENVAEREREFLRIFGHPMNDRGVEPKGGAAPRGTVKHQ